jgi:uncharacterized membrane protein required for colicin V production
MQLTGLNILDYLLLFILFLGGLVGLFRGVTTQLISLASLWFGLLVTLYLYRPLSNFILQGLGISKSVGDTLAFLLLLVVFFQAIRFFAKRLAVPPEEKKRKPTGRKRQVGPVEEAAKTATQKYITGPLGSFGGIIMGVILTAVWTSVVLGVFQFIFQVNVAEVAGSVTGATVPGAGIAVQMQSSQLIHFFNRILWVLVRSVSIFVLDSGPNILEVVIDRLFASSG